MNMMKRTKKVINRLRDNVRLSFAKIAVRENCSPFAVFDHAQRAKPFIRRNTSLLDHRVLGRPYRLFVYCEGSDAEKLLRKHPSLNTLVVTTEGIAADLWCENLLEVSALEEELNNLHTPHNTHTVLETIAEEMFMLPL